MAVLTAIAAAAAVGSVAVAAKSSKNQSKAIDQQAAATASQQQIAQQQLDMAKEDRARYKEKIQPIEDELIERNLDYGSTANQNKAAKDAAAAVTGAYSSARDKLNRSLGVNPNSQAYLQEVNKINLAEAAGSATAQTGARRGVVDKGMALTADAINIGKGLPSSAANALSSAGGMFGNAAGAYGSMATNYARESANNMNAIGSIGRSIGGMYQDGTLGKVGSAVSNWISPTPVVDHGGVNPSLPGDGFYTNPLAGP